MSVMIEVETGTIEGMLTVPDRATCVVLFVHGSGSSRLSVRNQFVAKTLNGAHIATLLIDLLTEQEDSVYMTRFNIDLLTKRVLHIIAWLQKRMPHMKLGLFGASTGAASALRAAAALPEKIAAVVSRGGRPDLAMEILDQVRAPTLLIVGQQDPLVIELNQQAYQKLAGEKELVIVPGATHLFEEEGCLEQVCVLARDWFDHHITSRDRKSTSSG